MILILPYFTKTLISINNQICIHKDDNHSLRIVVEAKKKKFQDLEEDQPYGRKAVLVETKESLLNLKIQVSLVRRGNIVNQPV